MLTREGCAGRLARFRSTLADRDLDGALVTDPRDLHWLLGQPLPSIGDFPAAALVATDGPVRLFCHEGAAPLLADEVLTYPWHIGFTRNHDQTTALAELLQTALAADRAGRFGYQAEHAPQALVAAVAAASDSVAWQPVDADLLQLQRAKDPDELVCLEGAVRVTLAAYDAASAAIAPGVREVEVLAAGHAAAYAAAGEPLWHGGDYQCASGGGAARDRACEDGELYVIDAQSIYRGYWADLSRTFAVGRVSALQQSVYDHLVSILEEVPQRLKPGMRGTELWHWMDVRIREHAHLADTGLVHHAGHGVGIRPHTPPDLNRDREGILEVGDVVSVEPGAYSDELRGGIRVENTFLITADGCKLLSEYPLELGRTE